MDKLRKKIIMILNKGSAHPDDLANEIMEYIKPIVEENKRLKAEAKMGNISYKEAIKLQEELKELKEQLTSMTYNAERKRLDNNALRRANKELKQRIKELEIVRG